MAVASSVVFDRRSRPAPLALRACHAIWLAAALSSEVLAADATPTEVVRKYYANVGLLRDQAARSDFIDPARAVLDAADRLEQTEGGSCLDPNMVLDAPAYDAAELSSSLKLTEAISGDKARVVVTFTIFGEPRRMQWMLGKVDGAWRIADLFSVIQEWSLSMYQCE